MLYLPRILFFVTTTKNEIYIVLHNSTRGKYGMLDENPIYSYDKIAFLYVLKTPGTTVVLPVKQQKS